MPLIVPRSMQIGPRPSGSSAPATLPEYLASIGKASWYGGFRAPLLLFSDTANTIPVVNDGEAWRRWLPSWTAGGFASYWSGSSPRRLVLGTSRNGKPGVYGDGIEWNASLVVNALELNRQYTCLMSTWTTMNAVTSLYSHAVNVHSFRSNGASNEPTVAANNTAGITVEKVVEATPVDSTTCAHRVGWSTNGTSHYNNSPSLLQRSDGTQSSNSTVHEIWFTERLTAKEISGALKYLL